MSVTREQVKQKLEELYAGQDLAKIGQKTLRKSLTEALGQDPGKELCTQVAVEMIRAAAGGGEEEEEEEVKDEEVEEEEEAPKEKGTKKRSKSTKESSSATKKKKKKDPNMPKKGRSSYMIFQAENRERVKAANPTLKVTELSKKFGEEWAALSSDQKQVYTEKAVAEKKIADEKIAAYLAANPDAAKAAAADEDDDDEGGGKKAAKKKKDPNMPKKGRTSYLIFQEENRERVKAANPTLKMTELSKKFGEEWAALSSEQKQVYIEKAVAEKKIADEKIAAYLAANPDAAAAAAASAPKRSRKKSSDSLAGLSEDEAALQRKIDKLKKLLKDCGFTPRISLKDSRHEQIEKLEAVVQEKGIEMSWKAEKRADFKRSNESKRELEALTENSKIMAKTDKRKKARVDYAKAAKPDAIAGIEEDSDEESSDGSLFSKEESD